MSVVLDHGDESPVDPVLLSISDAPAAKRDLAAEHQCAFWEQTGLVAPTW